MTHTTIIKPIKALKDNYIWAIINPSKKTAIVIDPGEAAPVLQFLQSEQLHLQAIFITHHHWDHTNGILALTQEIPVPVYGASQEKIAGLTNPLQENDSINLPGFATYQILAIPGHTLGHIAYYTAGHVFTGDTLFAGGCGRLFEGTACQLYASLQKLNALPSHTLIYCGHEYTYNNLLFAQMVEPNNIAITERLEKITKLTKTQPTLPVTLAEEQLTNPFLRCHETSIQNAVRIYAGAPITDPREIFALLRKWKDHF